MVESTTQHYGWTKPEVTKSASTWGGFLNSDLDSIDSLVFANQQAMVPIGAITMFGGAAAPANWLLCQGQSLSIAAPYDKLFAVFGYVHGGSGANFNLPNLQQKFPLGAGPNALGSGGGAFSYTIAIGNLPPHNHPASQDAHNHGISDPGHSHVIATGSHGHTIATGGHAHGASLMRFVGSGGTQGVGISPNNVVIGNTDAAGNLGGNTDTAGNLGGNTDFRGTGINQTDVRQPNVYTGNTGSGAALSIVPPFIAINFIVRFQ